MLAGCSPTGKGLPKIPRGGWVGLARWVRNIGFLPTESHPTSSHAGKAQFS